MRNRPRRLVDAPKNVNPKSNKSKDFMFWLKTVGFAAVCALVIALLWLALPQGIKNSVITIFSGEKEKITIGVLMIDKEREQQNYEELATHLSSQSKFKFVIDAIDITKANSLKDAQEKVTSKNWDIAFTTEPFTSIAAINEGYFFTARMSKPTTSEIQTAIIVKKDSPIKSLDDISTKTKLAMGDSYSAALYYMPIYDLYGKGFTRVYQRPLYFKNAVDALDNKNVDAAVVLYSNNFENRKELAVLDNLSKKIDGGDYRVVSLSRPIVSGSVYISPKRKEQKTHLEEILNAVPKDIREKAKYEVGQREEDYGFFKGLKRRVDTILDCADGNPRTTNVYDLAIKSCAEDVEGYISGIRYLTSEQLELFVRSISTEYSVLVSQNDLIDKLKKIFGLQNQSSVDSLYSKLDKIQIKISKVPPTDIKGGMTRFDFTDRKNLINLEFKQKSTQNT